MELPAAAAVLENGVGRGVRDVTSGVGMDGRHSAGSEMDEEMTLEVFRACADKGRKKSLRSLEIPLDNLLSGIIYTAGGRDVRGGPVLLLTQPKHLDLETLIEMTDQEFFDMLAYFTSVPSEDSRSLGFSVVIDGEAIHDFLLRVIIRGLATMNSEERGLFHKVFFVSGVRDITLIDWKKEYGTNPDTPDLPFVQVKSMAALHRFVDKTQLTSEFGGLLSYDHQDWVRFRMQVEPFLCDCISISKRLASVIEPFTSEGEEPSSIEEAEQSLYKHRLIRRKTLEVLHIDELANEGNRIDEHMQATASPHLSSNPDFTSTLATISTLLGQISNVKERVEVLWTTRRDKLQASIKQKSFETEASKVIEWFEEYAEEFFQTHTELGDSFDVATALSQEVDQFETSTQEILGSTSYLLSSGEELEQLPYADQNTLQPLMGKIKQLVTDFDSRLSKRKKKLDDSVRLHRLTAAALDWCIESATILSSSDLLSANPTNVQCQQLQRELDRYLATYPPPSDRDVQTLHELTEAVDSQWIKDNALFAYNRITEVKERFEYYRKTLSDKLAEPQRVGGEKGAMPGEKEAVPGEKEAVPGEKGGMAVSGEEVSEQRRGRKEVRIAQTVLTQLSQEEEPDGVLLENKAIDTTPPGVSGVKLRHPKGVPNSLMYDDTGVGHAMMLLKSVADTAETKLTALAVEDNVDAGRPSSRSASPHRISKQDISNPTKTTGPLFKTGTSLDSDEEDNLLRIASVSERRAKILEMPCPIEENLKIQTKHARHRRKLMEELIQTEEVYIRDMQWVVDYYMPAMDDISNVPRNLVGKKNLIFSTIPQLLHFNKLVILPQLKILGKCPVKLGQFFMTLEEDLLNYSMYFKNLPQQTQLMQEGGIGFFGTISNAIGDRFLLNSYLIKPFQRITKYKIFLEEMSKHSNRTDLKGKLKEYHDKLKEAQKMVDFILRHGNDLLAVECLRGYEGNMREHGKILRQGDLVLVEYTKHHRRMFLFEHSIILTKKRKPKHQVHEVASSEVFDFKQEYKTSDYGLRENVDGHPTRFQLYRKKEILTFQAETVAEKNTWVQDIWDLFFSHMLSLKDQNLEAHGSNALTSIVASGTATIGRSFGHSLRRAVSVRHSGRYSRETRPSSLLSSNSAHRHSGSAINEETGSPSRHSGTFVDLRPRSMCEPDPAAESDRSSLISSSSTSTISSSNNPDALHINGHTHNRQSHTLCQHLSSTQQNEGADSPILMLPRPPSSGSSSESSLRTASPVQAPVSPRLGDRRSPQPPESPLVGNRRSPQPPRSPQGSSSSSLDSLVTQESNVLMYGTPV